jgi:hypothetical protein
MFILNYYRNARTGLQARGTAVTMMPHRCLEACTSFISAGTIPEMSMTRKYGTYGECILRVNIPNMSATELGI